MYSHQNYLTINQSIHNHLRVYQPLSISAYYFQKTLKNSNRFSENLELKIVKISINSLHFFKYLMENN